MARCERSERREQFRLRYAEYNLYGRTFARTMTFELASAYNFNAICMSGLITVTQPFFGHVELHSIVISWFDFDAYMDGATPGVPSQSGPCLSQSTICFCCIRRIGRRLCDYADNKVRCASGSMRFAAPLEKIMGNADLQGHLILVVEDEPLVALDLAEAFEAKGAKVTTVSNVSHALTLAEGGGIAGAVLDYELADGNCAGVCHVLKTHNVPFIIYSGVKPESAPTADAPQLSKPADPDVVARMLSRLIVTPRCSPITSLSRSLLNGLERN